jgi:hypothetical protein
MLRNVLGIFILMEWRGKNEREILNTEKIRAVKT